jgi:hypothetical protein
MTIGAGLDPGKIDTRVASLIVDVAGEIPIQVSVTSGDGRVGCFDDEIAAVLIDILEKE